MLRESWRRAKAGLLSGGPVCDLSSFLESLSMVYQLPACLQVRSRPSFLGRVRVIREQLPQ